MTQPIFVANSKRCYKWKW